MKTADERVASLHEKMGCRRRLHERRRTGLIGAASVAIFLCLSVCIFAGGAHNGGSAGMYSGSTMLFEGSGGYVLVAVIAFMAGAAAAVLLIRQKVRAARKEVNGENKESEEIKEKDTESEGNCAEGDQT